MSKVIKQMQMDALKATFGAAKNYVVLNIVGLNAVADNQFRSTLRKKNVRLLQVKNSLARLAFKDLGIDIGTDSDYWKGATTFAWGGTSVAELSQSIEAELKNPKTQAQFKDKVKIKGAIAEGLLVPFAVALKMPTRQEAIARVLMLALAPGARIAGQIIGPASALASQIKQVSEKKEETAPTPAPEAPAPEAAPAPAAG
jgi:large subunit ribosomal protein L10